MAEIALFGEDLFGNPINKGAGRERALCKRFVAPPFSVLDSRQGYWQARKKAWIRLGMKSELGREGLGDTIRCVRGKKGVRRHDRSLAHRLKKMKDDGSEKYFDIVRDSTGRPTGISMFDPVLCELCYNWFCPQEGRILDPFSGGSVRGIVASYLGYDYTGIDLSEKQIEANREQGRSIVPEKPPTWMVGDSVNLLKSTDGMFDMIFSCPPYADLERYSDNPRDISTMEYPAFLEKYGLIIRRACKRLRKNRFACFIVGDVRDPVTGNYRNFPNDTVKAFEEAGCHLYNWGIMIHSIGSLPIRVGQQFSKYRKLGKGHQDVLVFYKGEDCKDLKEWAGDVFQ